FCLVAGRPRLEDRGLVDAWWKVADRLKARFRAVRESEPSSPLARSYPIVAEKILSRGEDLPSAWPIDGTVGYEYLNALNGLFVDPSASESIEWTYAEFTGDREPFADVLYDAKMLIALESLASEVNMLARLLDRASEGDRPGRDFPHNGLRRTPRGAIASSPVYRTYLRPDEPVSPRDRGYIEQAVARARRRGPAIDPSVYNFLQDALLMQH